MLTDSTIQQLSDEEVIRTAAEETKSPFPPDRVLQVLQMEVKSPTAWQIRFGNTIFITHSNKPGIGLFRALNADTARNYVENGKQFCVAARKKGFYVLASDFDDPTILNIFKTIAMSPPIPGMDYKVTKKGSGYRAMLYLGPPPAGVETTTMDAVKPALQGAL